MNKMKQNVKEMAELYAIGSVSECQLRNECNSLVEYAKARYYARKYAQQYDSDMQTVKSYVERLISVEDIILANGYEKTLRLLKWAGLSLNPSGYETTMWKYNNACIEAITYTIELEMTDEVMWSLKRGNSLEVACSEWDIYYFPAFK